MEKLMQYVWQYRLCPQDDLHTADGQRVRIIDPGLLNTGSGPDFFNAKVKIGDRVWAGNVEIHVRASDWMRHGHQDDHAYDSVILHVVQTDDASIRRPDGAVIPQMVMNCAADFSRRYQEFVNNPTSSLRCAAELPFLPQIYVTDWLTALGYERLYAKVERVQEYLRRTTGNWIECAYLTLARGLGFGNNSEPMERLAASLPLKMLLKHRDSLTDIEALLLGQAGLLDDVEGEPGGYVAEVKSAWRHLSNKFGLHLDTPIQWKTGRMRPANQPHRRIAALAAFVNDGFSLPANMLSAQTLDDLRDLFRIDLEGYWARHYNFTPTLTHETLALSDSSINTLLINVAIPFVYAYSLSHGDNAGLERAETWLQELPGERNSITALYAELGLKGTDAFTSQALIQLHKEYCQPRKCLYCRWGHRFLSLRVKP